MGFFMSHLVCIVCAPCLYESFNWISVRQDGTPSYDVVNLFGRKMSILKTFLLFGASGFEFRIDPLSRKMSSEHNLPEPAT